MSHHGIDLGELSPIIRELQQHQERIQGRHPDGKIADSDEGAIAISITSMGGKVIMAFAEPSAWVGMTPDQAAKFGLLLIERAREAGLSKPLTLTI